MYDVEYAITMYYMICTARTPALSAVRPASPSRGPMPSACAVLVVNFFALYPCLLQHLSIYLYLLQHLSIRLSISINMYIYTDIYIGMDALSVYLAV